jgi:hypothetical protein
MQRTQNRALIVTGECRSDAVPKVISRRAAHQTGLAFDGSPVRRKLTDDGMPSTKALRAFFARQTFVNEATFYQSPKALSREGFAFQGLSKRGSRTIGEPYASA